MTYSFNKAKLPKGTSYPLKRSALDAALTQANVTNVFYVAYLRNQRVGEVMRADYHGDHRRDYSAPPQTSVTVYSVPGKQRAAVESLLLNEGIEAIVRWLEKAETAGNTWRSMDHCLVLKFAWPSLELTES